MSRNLVFLTIVFSQFCGTSVWFAVNAILPQLQAQFGWATTETGNLSASIQLGFISGTLLYALLGISDRFSPSRVFFVSAMLVAGANVLALIDLESTKVVITSRFLTGVFLGGVYPVGMKIAADWTEKGLGLWLGALVGALALGTAFPMFLKAFPMFISPTALMLAVSGLAVVGGIVMLAFVPDGPFRKQGSAFNVRKLAVAFKSRPFRKAAFGYFGHMWELYAMWAFIAIFAQHLVEGRHDMSAELLAFITIAFGAVGCIVGGVLSRRFSSAMVAQGMLIGSALCCVLSYWIADAPLGLVIFFLAFWGFTIIGDSPQFSSLVSTHATPEVRGSAITMVTCIGFLISVVSIQMLGYLVDDVSYRSLFLFLAPGPILGLVAMRSYHSPMP